MLWEGLNLLVIGMGTVLVFLALLVVCVQIMSTLVARFSPPPRATPASLPAVPVPQQDELVAAITAAVHHHRQRS